MKIPLILITEDDRFLADSIEKLLSGHGFRTVKAHTAEDAVNKVELETPQLMILDLGLPDQDGVSLCRRLRQQFLFPILMLTSRSEAVDKVIGFEVGADDYITKPFEAYDLMARVRALIRRATAYTDAPGARTRLSEGPLIIDDDQHLAFVNEVKLDLTETEFRLLRYLVANAGRAIGREQLFEQVWGYDIEFSSNSLEVLIYRLRTKIESAGVEKIIQTVRGFGYKLTSEIA